MGYIDYTYYLTEYKGSLVDSMQFEVLEQRASDIIDILTRYVLHGVEFTSFATLIQTNVKKAIANQIDYMALNGGETAIHGGSPSSVNIGNFSYQDSTGETKSMVSPATLKYLGSIGLLYAGVDRL